MTELLHDNNSAMLAYGREIAAAFDDDFSLMTFLHYYLLNLGVKKGLETVNNSVIKAHKITSIIKNSTYLLHAFCTLSLSWKHAGIQVIIC